ncbi:MAG: ankyrin repeat domain-containing protein [Emcibacter sp.]|nr:ankyrin repeat domain-containing protein [Emcibacter sp.]HEC00290.1 ankyrin repeat domain-containing protein [Sphingomonadales bacterium]
MSRDDLFKAIDVADEAKLRAILATDSALASSRSTDGVSAILFTLYLGKSELTQALLDHNPDLDKFDLAALNMHEKLARVLAHESDIDQLSGDGFSALHLACFFGSLESAALLVEMGANVNIHADNMTDLRPLHSACAAGQGAIASLLLKAGAKPNVIQAGGYTPLMTAASLGNDPVVDMLLEFGADVTVKSDDNRTAADFAKAAGFDGLISKL